MDTQGASGSSTTLAASPLKVDLALGKEPGDVPARIRAAAALGYTGLCSAEAAHDPFIPLAVAATVNSTLELQTQVAVALSRNPLSLATIANDVQYLSQGRLLLGLGTQIQHHIEKRFSMPWSRPVARMREMITAMRAIWHAWNSESPLDFRGEFYRHLLVTPNFQPDPNPFGPPPIHLAAVGPAMTALAGELADGLILHPFTTPKYFQSATLPAAARGADRAGRSMQGFQISAPVMVATGADDQQIADARRATRKHLAFYASVPAYQAVLAAEGLADVHPALNSMSKRGQWEAMADLIPESFVDAAAVVGPPHQIADGIRRRFGGAVHRVSLMTPRPLEDELAADIVADLNLDRAGRGVAR